MWTSAITARGGLLFGYDTASSFLDEGARDQGSYVGADRTKDGLDAQLIHSPSRVTAPIQILTLSPDLDALGTKHEVDVVAGVEPPSSTFLKISLCSSVAKPLGTCLP